MCMCVRVCVRETVQNIDREASSEGRICVPSTRRYLIIFQVYGLTLTMAFVALETSFHLLASEFF